MIGQPFARTSATLVDIQTTRLLAPNCKKLKTFLVIPAISLSRPDWIGASVICYQINYTLPWSFRFIGWKQLKRLATALNFSLCIRWRVGHTVYRYKLFSAVGETSLFVPDYAGEIIGPHCCLELWSSFLYTSFTSVVPILLQLNKLLYPSSCHDFTDYSIANVTACEDSLYINGVTSITADNLFITADSIDTTADADGTFSDPLFGLPNTFSLCSAWHSNGSGITVNSTSITADSTTILASDEG